MWGSKHPILALLVTDDPAVEIAVRAEAEAEGARVEQMDTRGDALSFMADSHPEETIAVVDLDAGSGGRRVLETAGGTLPVLVITRRVRPWLASLERRHRICATLTKPFTRGELRDALQRVRAQQARVGRCWTEGGSEQTSALSASGRGAF